MSVVSQGPVPQPATVTSYQTRVLNVTFQRTAANTLLKLTGLRVSANITDAMIPNSASAILRINGMKLSDINALTVAGLSYQTAAPGTNYRNFVSIDAGTPLGTVTVFTGSIVDAYPDGNMPDMGFIVRATPSVNYTMPPATPNQFPGPTSLNTIFQTLATSAGLSLRNNGVTGTVSDAYFFGSIMDQIRHALESARCYGKIDDVNKVLIITPRIGGSAQGGPIFSPNSGMIGYPQFETLSVVIRSIFDTSLLMYAAEPFTVQDSQFTAANNPPDNPWICTKVDYTLESQVPDGKWEMIVSGYPQSGAPSGVPGG